MRVLTEEQRQAKRARDRAYRERNREKVRETARKSAKKRHAAGLDIEYRNRPDVKERARKWKEDKRRALGILPKKHKKKDAAEQRRIERAVFIENFIGPPTQRKSMTDAEYYKWRIRNDPDFYAKELDRAQRYKARTRARYKDSLVKWAEMPQAMKEVKHLQYLISRQIKRTEYENHQRVA